MNRLDSMIAVFMILWVMKLQLRIWTIQSRIDWLNKISHTHFIPPNDGVWPYILTKESQNAETQVPTLHGENDVPATGDRGKLHGSGPAMGDKTKDT